MWTTTISALAFAAGALVGWCIKPAPACPPDPDPTRIVAPLLPGEVKPDARQLKPGDRVKTPDGRVGTVAGQAPDAPGCWVVDIGGVGVTLADSYLSLEVKP